MRLTVLSVGYPLAQVSPKTAGGAEQVLSTIDKALVRSGHRSLVLAPSGSRCDGLLIPVQIPSGTLDEKSKRTARRQFKQQLDRILEQYSVDIVHMHGLDFSDYLPQADVPVIATLHLPLSWYSVEALHPFRPSVRLVSVSRTQAQTAPTGVGIDGVVPNGIDLDDFRPQQKKGRYAVVIGRICPEKASHLAIEAAELAHLQLMIAGTAFGYPEHQEYFENVIRPRLDENVHFIGPAGGVHKADLLAGAKCLLIPSLAPETSSLVAMEGLAAGTPVIAMRSGALSEIVDHGKTGFLVNSVEEMAAAIANADSISSDACRREAERRFAAERMFKQYFSLYVSAVSASFIPELVAA